MDQMDLRILKILQKDSSLPVSEVAKEIGLSASPCWKRIKRMQDKGVIKYQISVLEAEQLGCVLTVFINIKTGEHSTSWLKEFSETVTAMPEVVELHRIAGDVDYMLKVIVPDKAAFDSFYKDLIGPAALTEVTSYFTMETIKETTALPI